MLLFTIAAVLPRLAMLAICVLSIVKYANELSHKSNLWNTGSK